MKHTICCPQGRITIWSESDPKHGPMVRATIAGTLPPQVDLWLHPEHAGMLAQAFELATEECQGAMAGTFTTGAAEKAAVLEGPFSDLDSPATGLAWQGRAAA